MVKKTIFPLTFRLFASNCTALDSTGATNSYKGSVVKSKIHDAAFSSDFLYYNSVLSDSSSAAAVAMIDSYLAEIFANIDDSKYYGKTSVDKCVQDIRILGLSVMSASLTVATNNDCSKLQANPAIL
ncbi:TIGR04452 family lipoprotein [Leptospira fletcheri]|uniref:TIGR04452 family lipoprotein n=1 Tax=Leptospira fletcheri TaxID=2484981 RepID=A0A4V3JDI5_9LEPT|nr:TIGR04452 family lipoprotein [Leptospira fletcheri]TGK10079.1 TIGR04452 family lipoprotein [Leptospira fletcheri]